MLDREAIKAADDVQREKVSVPEWGGEVYVQSLTGKGRDAYIQESLNRSRSDDPRDVDVRGMEVLLLTMTVCDEDGNLLFKPDDKEWLLDKSARAIERVSSVARRLSGLDQGAIEDLAGN